MENIIQIILKDLNKTNEKIEKYEIEKKAILGIIEKLTNKIKRIVLILSLSIIINSIAIILINLRG